MIPLDIRSCTWPRSAAGRTVLALLDRIFLSRVTSYRLPIGSSTVTELPLCSVFPFASGEFSLVIAMRRLNSLADKASPAVIAAVGELPWCEVGSGCCIFCPAKASKDAFICLISSRIKITSWLQLHSGLAAGRGRSLLEAWGTTSRSKMQSVPLRRQFLHLWPPKDSSHFIFCFLHSEPGLASTSLLADPPQELEKGIYHLHALGFRPGPLILRELRISFSMAWTALALCDDLAGNRNFNLDVRTVEGQVQSPTANRLLKAEGALVFPRANFPWFPRSRSPGWGAQWVSFVENEESLLDRANQSN